MKDEPDDECEPAQSHRFDVASVAVLKADSRRAAQDVRDIRSELHDIRSTVTELLTAVRAFKWLVAIAVPAGPSIGVMLVKLLD